MFLISFFGCCGAIKENICLTWTVSKFISIYNIYITSINLYIMPTVCHRVADHLDPELRAVLCLSEAHRWADVVAGATEPGLGQAKEWHRCHVHLSDERKLLTISEETSSIYTHSFPLQLKCCGINGPIDYTKANITIPQSCYVTNSTSTTSTHTVYPDGCLNKLIDFYEHAFKFVRVFGWILIAVEVSTLIYSICALGN